MLLSFIGSVMAPKRAITVDKGKTPNVDIVESSTEGSVIMTLPTIKRLSWNLKTT